MYKFFSVLTATIIPFLALSQTGRAIPIGGQSIGISANESVYPVIDGASSDNDLKFTVNTQFAKLDLAWRRERNELVEGEQ